MNKIEAIKAEKDGLDILDDLCRYAKIGWEAVTPDDAERLKWYGVFLRKPTPGYFMMRIRITNGIASTDQVRALTDITRRFGRDILDITTRQQIELRWIKIDAIPEILKLLHSVGLCSLQTGMDNIRNVIGCPLAGLAPSELFDASPIARDFTGRFVRNREFSNLPRKFNVMITGCRDNCAHAESQDIALVPAMKHGPWGGAALGFNVLVGGKMGSGGYRVASDLDVFVEPGEAAELCAAITLIFRDFGPREARSKARLSFLLEERGDAWLRDTLERRLGRRLPRAGRDQRTDQQADHIGVARQKQRGLSSVGLLVPVGRIRVHQLEETVRLADTYGDSQLRFTTSQSLIVPNVPSERVPELLSEPLLEELSPSPSPAMRGLVSCTGIDFCKLALIDTKTRAVALATQLEVLDSNGGEPVRIHWSGCPAGCGNHAVADIGLEGKRIRRNGEVIEAVDIYVGGRSGPNGQRASRVLEDIPCDELLPVLQGLMDKQEPVETVGTSPQLAVNLA
jgi:ferredoxin-nitrite reductase